MVELITSLLNVTIATADRIHEVYDEELHDLLLLRDEVIIRLQEQDAISQLEKELLAQIMQYDSHINERMKYLMEEASQELSKLRMSQLQKNRYDSAYVPESYFIDRKE
ncbi:hypothetical protein [Paenibacillus sp. YIM B09110]|uniref:hypothetical protein n=1 Tax=Paenibacillus sp. YIM B09110 TaxID=3126102 RepID=UPI00301CB0C7